MKPTPANVDCSDRINDVMARHPSTVVIFNQFGIDTCCGGSETVEHAATHAGVDHVSLCDALRGAIEAESTHHQG